MILTSENDVNMIKEKRVVKYLGKGSAFVTVRADTAYIPAPFCLKKALVKDHFVRSFVAWTDKHIWPSALPGPR